MCEVPIWEKYMLTIKEAAEYFHIGEQKLRTFIDQNSGEPYLITIGNRTMVKRKMFEEYLNGLGAI